MSRLVGLLAAVAILLVTALGAAAWSVSAASDAYGLFQFEREDPASMETRRGALEGVSGWGPWERDVVVVFGRDRASHIHRVGDRPDQLPVPEVLVGEHGARYADQPPHEGAWRPFAVAAGAGFVVVGLAVWLAWRSVAVLLREGGGVIFGQRDPATGDVSRLSGSGTHGAGQGPPHVPYSPDWDPKNRVR